MAEFAPKRQDHVWMDMNRFSRLVGEVMIWKYLVEYQPSSLRERRTFEFESDSGQSPVT